MKIFLLFFFSINMIFCQEIIQIGMGVSYEYDIYYSFEDGITGFPERNNWELAIADKLINEISKIVSAEVNRAKNELTASGSISAVEREQIIRETEELTINNYALEIQDSLIEQLTPQLEVSIRQEVENELWQVFEEEWRNRSMKE